MLADLPEALRSGVFRESRTSRAQIRFSDGGSGITRNQTIFDFLIDKPGAQVDDTECGLTFV